MSVLRCHITGAVLSAERVSQTAFVPVEFDDVKMIEEFVVVVNETNVRRWARWTLWVITALVSTTFAVLCFESERKLSVLSKDKNLRENELRLVIVAPFFASVVVVLFVIVSFLLTFPPSKLKAHSAYLDTVLVTSLVHMFLTVLLCVLVMHVFRKQLKFYAKKESFYQPCYYEYYDESRRTDCYKPISYYTYSKWDAKDDRVFTATLVMGYVSAAMYFFHASVTLCLPFLFKKTPRKIRSVM